VHVVGRDPVQVLEAALALVDAHHALGAVEIDRAQGVADHDPGGVLLGRRHRVLQVQDHAVGVVQAGVGEELGLVAGQVQAAAAHALARGAVGAAIGQRRQVAGRDRRVGPQDRGLQAGVQHEGQRPAVGDLDDGVLHAEGLAALLGLDADPRAVHRLDSALDHDLQAAGVAQLDRHVAVGTDPGPQSAGLTRLRHRSSSAFGRTSISPPDRPVRAFSYDGTRKPGRQAKPGRG